MGTVNKDKEIFTLNQDSTTSDKFFIGNRPYGLVAKFSSVVSATVRIFQSPVENSDFFTEDEELRKTVNSTNNVAWEVESVMKYIRVEVESENDFTVDFAFTRP